MRLFVSLIAVGVLVFASSAEAVIISGAPDASTNAAPLNNTSPVDDPGWERVGAFATGSGNGTGVYLGNGWVLTAAHVNLGGSDFVVEHADGISSTAYDILSVGPTLTNPSNPFGVDPLTATTDLRLVQVDLAAGGPLAGVGVIDIADTPMTSGTAGVMIGTGETQTSLLASVVSTGVPDREGYAWSGSRDKKWADGTTVELVDGEVFESSGRDVIAFYTLFQESEGSGMAANNDSGSGFFVDTVDGWQLSGLAHSVLGFGNQDASTAAFGNVTAWSDLSYYADQINAIVVPEPTSLALLAVPTLLMFRGRPKRSRG